MTKNSNFKQFIFKNLEGTEIEIDCWTYDNYTGWGHKCDIWIGGSFFKTKRHSYLNRTWESFTYETLLRESVEAIYNAKKRDRLNREFVMAQIKAIEDQTRAEATAWIDNFQKVWAGLKDETREKIQKMDLSVETMEAANAAIKAAVMLDVIA